MKQRVRALFVSYSMALATALDGGIKNPWTMMLFVEDLKKVKQKNALEQ